MTGHTRHDAAARSRVKEKEFEEEAEEYSERAAEEDIASSVTNGERWEIVVCVEAGSQPG